MTPGLSGSRNGWEGPPNTGFQLRIWHLCFFLGKSVLPGERWRVCAGHFTQV